MRYVLGLQEASVAAMADGFAQGTRGPAFVNLHSAAGVGHALGNIFAAFRNQTPLVITAGQQVRSSGSQQHDTAIGDDTSVLSSRVRGVIHWRRL
jgi:thiamine pyrophosphate-dependent acetolactate synthase large subunit-like protein